MTTTTDKRVAPEKSRLTGESPLNNPGDSVTYIVDMTTATYIELAAEKSHLVAVSGKAPGGVNYVVNMTATTDKDFALEKNRLAGEVEHNDVAERSELKYLETLLEQGSQRMEQTSATALREIKESSERIKRYFDIANHFRR